MRCCRASTLKTCPPRHRNGDSTGWVQSERAGLLSALSGFAGNLIFPHWRINMLRTLALSVLLLALLSPLPFFAEEPINAEINAKIRQEGIEHSRIMHTMHFLTDVYGPRLTGSPHT